MENVLAEVRRRCEENPDKVLYRFLNSDGSERETYTYSEFLERTHCLAVELRQAEIACFGQPVLLAYPQGIEMLAAFFACVQLGAIPVPVPCPEAGAALPTALERLTLIQQDSGAMHALTTSSVLSRILEGASDRVKVSSGLMAPQSSLSWFASDEFRGPRSSSADVEMSVDQPILFLQYTSGSTQSPRGVIVSHANVLHNCLRSMEAPLELVSWLPQFHDMGLIAACLFPAIMGGSAVLFSSADFLRRPALWLETIGRYRLTSTVAPNFAYDYCLREDKIPDASLPSFDLSSLREMLFGAEPVRCRTFERFRDRFAICGLSHQALEVAYGLAENTLVVSRGGRVILNLDRRLLQRGQLRMDLSGNEFSDPYRLLSAGRPIPGVEVCIASGDDCHRSGENVIGEICVSGESKALGYWNKPRQTQEIFQAALSQDSAGRHYLRTGDLGFLHDGELFVCGRVKDLIIVRGRNFYPQDIEAVAERSCAVVRPGSVVCFGMDDDFGPENVVVLIEGRLLKHAPDLPAIAREIQRHCQLEVGTVALVNPRSIARTSSGKIARAECRRRWQAGEIGVINQHRQAPETVSNEVLNFLFHGVSLDDAQHQTLSELGVDSLTLVSISLEIKKHMQSLGLPNAEELNDLTLLQACTMQELRIMIQQAREQGPAWRPDLLAISSRFRSIEAAEKQQMIQDSLLPDNIQAAVTAFAGIRGTLLLTGCTGFLGAFLLEALLRLTESRMMVLVRAQDRAHARTRVNAALKRTGLWTERLQMQCDERVDVFCGDLSLPRLGLTSREWEECSHQVTSIYHCGAMVDYVRPYSKLRHANVNSTLDLLDLACTGRTKHFHLISSTFIFGWSGNVVLYESDCNQKMNGLNFGYSQSKWVAEQLALHAASRGLPVTIYRPSLITASLGMRYSCTDIMARVLVYMIRHGICSECTNQISCLPVDIVANNIVSLSLEERPETVTYHFTADSYYNLSDMARIITQEFGYEFERVPLDQFVDHLNACCQPGEPLFPLVPFFNQNHRRIERMKDKRYDNGTYRLLRQQAATCLPEPPLREIVRAMVTYLQHESMIPDPRLAAVGKR